MSTTHPAWTLPGSLVWISLQVAFDTDPVDVVIVVVVVHQTAVFEAHAVRPIAASDATTTPRCVRVRTERLIIP